MQPVKIYSTTYCPYCQSAKRLFESLGVKYEEILLDDKQELRQKLSHENNGWRTVPMIFVGTEFLGGFTDVKALHDQGQLMSKVNA